MSDPLRQRPMVEWIERQSNTPWSPGFSEEFQRGYDTAVEEAAAAYEAECAALATPPPDLPSVEALAEAMDESFWPDDLPFIDDRDGFWLPFAAKVRAALEGAPHE